MQRDLNDYKEFCDTIQNDELVFLFGTGISSALTGCKYSWWKWIVDGIDSLCDLAKADTLKRKLERGGSTSNMIFVVGEVICQAKQDGIYHSWMRCLTKRGMSLIHC